MAIERFPAALSAHPFYPRRRGERTGGCSVPPVMSQRPAGHRCCAVMRKEGEEEKSGKCGGPSLRVILDDGSTIPLGRGCDSIKKFVALAALSGFMISACVPSLQYRLGQGFYSDAFAKTQVQAAASAGKVKNLGRFSIDYFGCFNYSQDLTDQNVVIPAIQEKLKELGANVADNVVANQPWYAFVDVFLFPLACIHYTVSGEALLVEKGAMSRLKNFEGVGQESLLIFFKSNNQKVGMKYEHSGQ